MAIEPNRVRFEGQTFFRYSNYDSPFWSRNNRSAGRWNLAGRHATQYLSLDPDAAWAELVRHEGLRTEDEIALVRMPIWAVTVNQSNLADYSRFELAEDAGLDPQALIDDDWTRCQEEAERLRTLDYAGVVAPSAALPGGVNITLFGRRVRTSWGHPTQLASAVPACVVAVGSPAPGLASRVRHYGEAHTGYEAYVEHRAEAGGREDLESDHAAVREQLDVDPPRPKAEPFEDLDEEEEA
jgi:RES domain-containing protein